MEGITDLVPRLCCSIWKYAAVCTCACVHETFPSVVELCAPLHKIVSPLPALEADSKKGSLKFVSSTAVYSNSPRNAVPGKQCSAY